MDMLQASSSSSSTNGGGSSKTGAAKPQSKQGKTKSGDDKKAKSPLPAESPALQKPEVNADNGGTEFDADAADVQTPVGAKAD